MKVELNHTPPGMPVAGVKTAEEGKSFADVLAAGKRPTVAQFMAITGASAKEASTIIYQHKDWALYLEPSNMPSVIEAQDQLRAEVNSEIREEGWAGRTDSTGASAFEWIKPPEPENPGKVVPHFNSKGEFAGLGLIDGNGIKQTLGNVGNKAGFERLALGVDVGTAGLDDFAQKLGSSDFASLEFENVKELMPSLTQWISLYGHHEVWSAGTSEAP